MGPERLAKNRAECIRRKIAKLKMFNSRPCPLASLKNSYNLQYSLLEKSDNLVSAVGWTGFLKMLLIINLCLEEKPLGRNTQVTSCGVVRLQCKLVCYFKAVKIQNYNERDLGTLTHNFTEQGVKL